MYRTTRRRQDLAAVLKKDADTGASDVAIDPSNPHIVFAGLWQARRCPGISRAADPAAGCMSRVTAATRGSRLPAMASRRASGAKSASPSRRPIRQRVYALIEAEKGGLFRSDDGGKNWALINPVHALRQRAWYYSTLTVDPANPDDVWFPRCRCSTRLTAARRSTREGAPARRQS